MSVNHKIDTNPYNKSSIEDSDAINELKDESIDKKNSDFDFLSADEIATKVVNKSKNVNDTNRSQNVVSEESKNDSLNAKDNDSFFNLIGDLVSSFFGGKKQSEKLQKLKMRHKVQSTNINNLNSDIKNQKYKHSEIFNNFDSSVKENEMIDQRAKFISKQQEIEENISKLKLQGEK